MGNLLAYSGIVTKVRAMQAQLLTPAQYEELSALSSVSEIVEYLSRLPSYRDCFREIDERLLHRGDIEKVLTQSLYHDYARLYRFAGPTVRSFISLHMKHLEIDLINYCFRIVSNHTAPSFDLDYKKEFFDHYSKLSVEKLFSSASIPELIENLRGTEYYAPLHLIANQPDSTLFEYDLALELYHFSTVWKARKKVLKKKELELFTRDYGAQIDLLNMQWIYRSKKYYHLTDVETYALLLPIHYKVSSDSIKEMVESETLEDFLALIQRTPYGRQYDFTQNLSIEQMYSECLYRLYTIDRRRNPYSIATINTYLFLKEEELKRLTTVMECVRYQISPAETMRYVGGKKKL